MSEHPVTSIRNPTVLSGKNILTLLTKGKILFSKMELTDAAQTWLDDNPDLNEVIGLW